MEDGFNIRYCSQQDMDDFNAGLKDSVSTWGIPSLDGTETVEIKIPYVEVDGRKILLGNGLYLVKDEDGRYFGIMDTEFFEKYEKLRKTEIIGEN